MTDTWIDVTPISFNALLLLERIQLSWFPGWYGLQKPEMAIALAANPAVEWYLRHKCPEIGPWLDELMAGAVRTDDPQAIRRAEIAVLSQFKDLLVYALDPAIYDAQPFLGWDSRELTDLVDFTGKVVIDVGAGTGRLTWPAAEKAAVVYPVEPVANLRHYLWQKIAEKKLKNVYPQDGLITRLPFPAGFDDLTITGHVYGDAPEAEVRELERVTRPGGMVILCPGSSEREDESHACLVARGYAWSRFEEPRDGVKRKFWKTLPGLGG